MEEYSAYSCELPINCGTKSRNKKRFRIHLNILRVNDGQILRENILLLNQNLL